MKKYAFFLPQFHTIEENNKWWGEGFTEWTNVKKAKPLFRGHVQPLHPVNNNYYNLLEKETVQWQTELMHKYRIDGLIYYHYYFRGKKLLEKPAENLLHWKEIDQPFFFCWANHDWNRAWRGSKEILLKQEYGTVQDWNDHFDYLLPFFKDERYLKINNSPVFMIYISAFKEKEDMMSFFNEKCKEEGFDGIYVIETYSGENYPEGLVEFEKNISKNTEQIFIREPSTSRYAFWVSRKNILRRYARGLKMRINKYTHGNCLFITNGDKVLRYICKEPKREGYIHGLNFGFDNTPRHGKRGQIVTPPSKETIFSILDYLKDEEYIFINAWNEWAEGMELEPSEEYGYKWLEWIAEWSKSNDN